MPPMYPAIDLSSTRFQRVVKHLSKIEDCIDRLEAKIDGLIRMVGDTVQPMDKGM